jgi:putative sterol carrier protein
MENGTVRIETIIPSVDDHGPLRTRHGELIGPHFEMGTRGFAIRQAIDRHAQAALQSFGSSPPYFTEEGRFATMARRKLDALGKLVKDVQQGQRTQRLLGNISFVLQLRATEGDGEGYLAVEGGHIEHGDGLHLNPTATLDGARKHLLRVVQGDIDITHCFSRGEIRVSGNYYHAIDLSRLALAARQESGR